MYVIVYVCCILYDICDVRYILCVMYLYHKLDSRCIICVMYVVSYICNVRYIIYMMNDMLYVHTVHIILSLL